MCEILQLEFENESSSMFNDIVTVLSFTLTDKNIFILFEMRQI